MSEQIATNDDAAANEEEVDEQIEEDNVEKVARENGSGDSAPSMGNKQMSNKQIETADNAVASREEVKEQAQESRIDKVAFEDGVSKAAATEYIRRGRDHD